ncbi:unnamed protein product [Ascophyllum nodosum]
MTHFRTIAVVVLAVGVALILTALRSARSAPPAVSPATCPSGTKSTDGQCEVPKKTEDDVGQYSGHSLGGLIGTIEAIFNREREAETTLPQDPNADKTARLKQLEERRKEYRWSTEGIPVGTPYLEGYPPADEFPAITWIVSLVGALLRINVGTLRGTIGVAELVEALTDSEHATSFANRISQLFGESKIDDRALDIDDFKDLHAFPIKTPASVYDFEDDETFARLRLQGPNCVTIKKCTKAVREKLKVLDSDPEYENLKQKVDSLMTHGKLFVVDHELLAGIPATPIEDIPRYLAVGIALFKVVNDDLLPIKPVGIQLSQGEEATPIFVPEDGYNWRIAKASFEAADFIIHEVVSHLGNTHIVLEGPLVALNRQLPKEHPIHDLLKPHLEGTAIINWGAQNLLLREGATVDLLQANDIKESWTMVLNETLKRISKDFSPVADFEEREVTKTDFPGRYPYRDFGTLYWEAIYTWVKEYLDIYYKVEQDMEEDYELQGFVDEMTGIAQMKWLNEFNTSSDKKGLITKVLASLIYSASVLHAAVNFPQKPIMSFVPACPSSMFAPIPTDKKPRTFEDYLAHMPPLEIAKRHVALLTLLGSVFHTKLGDYEDSAFDDERVKAPLAKFQATIEEIEDDIVTANAEVVAAWRQRGKDKKKANNFGYTTLLPNYIPQSINI